MDPKMSEKKFSEWLANASKITPTSITTHFHLSKSSHLPYRENRKSHMFSYFPLLFLLKAVPSEGYPNPRIAGITPPPHTPGSPPPPPDPGILEYWGGGELGV